MTAPGGQDGAIGLLHPALAIQHAAHAAVQRDLARLNAVIDPSTSSPARGLDNYWSVLQEQLHHHHESEETNYWPLLLERRPELAKLLERNKQEHRAMAAAIAEFDAAIRRWQTDGEGAGASGALQHLFEVVTVHLDSEEAEIWPFIPDLITMDDLAAVQRDAGIANPPERMLPWALEGASAQVIASLEARLPAPALEMLTTRWMPQWDRVVAGLGAQD